MSTRDKNVCNKYHLNGRNSSHVLTAVKIQPALWQYRTLKQKILTEKKKILAALIVTRNPYERTIDEFALHITTA